MDDIIVIILTLVLTVVAAINQSKKKKQQTQQPESREPDFWEEILHGGKTFPQPVEVETEYNDEPARKPFPEMAGKKQSMPYKKKAVVNVSPASVPFREGQRNEDVLRFSGAAEKSEASEVKTIAGSNVLEDFSLKNAVIYSEILRPKYF